ncbi:hypothetical protein, partial [Cronobacter muytjensii]|uniref:hypothetical protein n=1 Tax=Cronobacter muytjensii TaxID=413501 RepID=UPI001F3239DB
HPGSRPKGSRNNPLASAFGAEGRGDDGFSFVGRVSEAAPAIGKPGIRARSLSPRRETACVRGEQVSALNGYVRQGAR